jgi:hypothetical protein
VTGPGLGDAIITTFLTPSGNGGDTLGTPHTAEVGGQCNLTFLDRAAL